MNKLHKEYIKYIKDSKNMSPEELTKGLVKQIQAFGVEGEKQEVTLEALLTGTTVQGISGTSNSYTNYTSQVMSIYKKYSNRDQFGNQQIRAVIDLRTAFLSGEGMNVIAENPKTAEFIEKFMFLNQLDGVKLVNMIKGSEMAGQSAMMLKPEKVRGEDTVKVLRIPFNTASPFEPIWEDNDIREKAKALGKRNDMKELVPFLTKDFVYVRTGGDDFSSYGPTPRAGLILGDAENYDRAIKDMRRLNHIFARVTPYFKVDAAKDTKDVLALLKKQNWVIGKAVVTPADFTYVTPGTGAHENLKSELTATIKTISAVTACPVHWLGFVDLMSNRSTAETLYNQLKNGTSNERIIWESALYEMILKAQEIFIDGGGDLTLDPKFDVKLPLLDLSEFESRIKGYSQAYHDEAISKDDYTNAIPGIDPIKTKAAIKQENEDMGQDILSQKIDVEELKDDRNTEK